MPLNKIKIKEDLERERDVLLGQMSDMGKMNPETGQWEATPEADDFKTTDQNDMADKFEDYESKSSMIEVLKGRLKSVMNALNAIDKETFGTCKICNKKIEAARLEANPAARTCKEHMLNSSQK